jgi:hypothetical protein
MRTRAEELAGRLKNFNDEVVAFVENCAPESWNNVCAWEEWSVGVTARHIGAGHYAALGLAKMIVSGEKLPALTMDQITESANQHAREHADCTRAEVLDILRKNGEAVLEYVSGLSNAELDRTGYLAPIGGDVSAHQFIENVVLQSGGQHLANMKAAVQEVDRE